MDAALGVWKYPNHRGWCGSWGGGTGEVWHFGGSPWSASIGSNNDLPWVLTAAKCRYGFDSNCFPRVVQWSQKKVWPGEWSCSRFHALMSWTGCSQLSEHYLDSPKCSRFTRRYFVVQITPYILCVYKHRASSVQGSKKMFLLYIVERKTRYFELKNANPGWKITQPISLGTIIYPESGKLNAFWSWETPAGGNVQVAKFLHNPKNLIIRQNEKIGNIDFLHCLHTLTSQYLQSFSGNCTKNQLFNQNHWTSWSCIPRLFALNLQPWVVHN